MCTFICVLQWAILTKLKFIPSANQHINERGLQNCVMNIQIFSLLANVLATLDRTLTKLGIVNVL
jgi:hypothetical protein